MWQGVVNLKDDFLTRFWVILVQFMMLFVRIVQLLSALQQRDVASPVAIELHVFFFRRACSDMQTCADHILFRMAYLCTWWTLKLPEISACSWSGRITTEPRCFDGPAWTAPQPLCHDSNGDSGRGGSGPQLVIRWVPTLSDHLVEPHAAISRHTQRKTLKQGECLGRKFVKDNDRLWKSWTLVYPCTLPSRESIYGSRSCKVASRNRGDFLQPTSGLSVGSVVEFGEF